MGSLSRSNYYFLRGGEELCCLFQVKLEVHPLAVRLCRSHLAQVALVVAEIAAAHRVAAGS